MRRDWQNEAAALWLAPLVATIPLIPFLSIPSSPFFLGRFMDDPTHPMNWPHAGPLISALALIVCAGADILASQIARMIVQGFRQADLRAFANSGTSPILGCLCGLAAGGFIAYFANRRLARVPIWCAPV